MTPQEEGLSKITIILMIIVALVFDGIQLLLQLIPILGQILAFLISVFAFLTFYLWFKLKGLHFSVTKRLVFFGGTAFEVALPILNAIPIWTASVSFVAISSRIKKVVPGLDIIKK